MSVGLPALCRDIRGLDVAVMQLLADAPSDATLEAIVARGNFRPTEDEGIGFWFARFLTIRDNLWVVIDRVRNSLETEELRSFLIGYAAVCLLIRIDRVLLFRVGRHSTVQRKLNEAFPEYRIPRKQYTGIYSAFVDHANVMAIRDAMHFKQRHRKELVALQDDSLVGFIATQLPEFEAALNPSKRRYVRRSLDYVSHKWRRRSMVTAERLFAKVLEGFGRAASEFVELENKAVTGDVFRSIQGLLEPGDVVVTRHAKALTNLFFPGFWPHVALYVGTPPQRDAARIDVEPEKRERWVDDICVLEAKKDGVLLRPLLETLTVDAFVVLRPQLDAEDIRLGIERALQHEGKKYNFDFNFFTSDRVVCTEIVYRAYDGLGDVQFPLQERAGRQTLSAEDLLNYALEKKTFTPIAIFGVPGAVGELLTGDRVRQVLSSSYHES